ncbi:MAG: uracil-DNA glycosylase [Acidimicrobiia bacterium]|nr:uracil-DNA glycosylase [Acidimicrobiia bacterium]NND12618.1 uracil-DNA glycosylase [Acidimicrobiia bacterium]NNL47372.1 uracil-DNA glycosylase [Acidimicrobiia bacterium]
MPDPLMPEERVKRLRVIADAAATCSACVLAKGRTNVVFGAGNPDADLMVIGEGPGKDEDEQGEPFVGRSGRLLTDLLADAGWQRADIYISNVVKCRPPGNRDPQQDEIDACKGYLVDQIRLVDPLVVMTLGNFSSRLLLKRATGITKLRGHVYPWWGRHVVPTFHPAAALRGGEKVTELIRQDIALARSVVAEARPAEQLGLFS